MVEPTDTSTPQPSDRDRAEARARYLTGLVWHVGAFTIVNVFFWFLDAITGSGITWAHWITLMWGFALAFHALAYFVDGSGLEARAAEAFVERHRTDPDGG